MLLFAFFVGALSIVGALHYKSDFQSILAYNNEPTSKTSGQARKAFFLYGNSYNPDDNKVDIGYYMAMAGGAFFILNAAVNIINIVVYFVWRRSLSSTKPAEDADSNSKSALVTENGTERNKDNVNEKKQTTKTAK